MPGTIHELSPARANVTMSSSSRLLSSAGVVCVAAATAIALALPAGAVGGLRPLAQANAPAAAASAIVHDDDEPDEAHSQGQADNPYDDTSGSHPTPMRQLVTL